MKKTIFTAGAALALSMTFIASAAENTSKPEYLSDWWHQSVNVVGSYHSRFGPTLRNDTYLEYEAFAKKEWLDFYGYVDAPRFFGGDGNSRGIWNQGSPLFIEIEPRFSLDKLTHTDLSFGQFKEWYFANNYIYDMNRSSTSRQRTWYMGLGTDIETGLPMSLSLNIYAKYQWQNYGASNENDWDGYRFKIKYFVPLTPFWGGQLNYIGFTNFDWGSDMGNDQYRTSNSIASSHVLALNYDRWHYSVVARYFHNGGQWEDGSQPSFQPMLVKSTGFGWYLVAGYNF